MKKLFFLVTLLLAAYSVSQAQVEICNNGIDDDFDGFTDCYDADGCSGAPECAGFYLNNQFACDVPPPEVPDFSMVNDFNSDNGTANHLGRIVVGDLDRDGVPEIFSTNKFSKKLFILNGDGGTTKATLDVSAIYEPGWDIAIANIDNDNCAEIFVSGIIDGGPPPRRFAPSPPDQLWMFAYDCNLNEIWRTKIWESSGSKWNILDTQEMGLADFDGDGLVELYFKDMILDAHTGTIIIPTQATNDSQWELTNAGPTAVNMDDPTNPATRNLEFISGLKIYDVNLGTRTLNSGSLSLRPNAPPEFRIKNVTNATSIADYDQDGNMDILGVGGLDHDNDPNTPLMTTIFYWNVANDIVTTYYDPIPGPFTILTCLSFTGSNYGTSNYYQYGWHEGAGRLNIADIDGDGELNVTYVTGSRLYALDENLNELWVNDQIIEGTSGFTGCTLFDFNGDGSSEIVYRDEQWLYIIDGAAGVIQTQQACFSRTQKEYPIVVDVDADGETELCVTCGFSDTDWADVDYFCDMDHSEFSHVRAFRSSTDPWVPARRLWNQHGYFNVNVNDDLSIPIQQQMPNQVWAYDWTCPHDDQARDVRPLNSFLNQSPFLNEQGCPGYASPDLALVPGSLQVDDPTCPETDFQVSFEYTNLGDIAVSGDMPVTFYKGDPSPGSTDPTLTRLNTINVTLNDFRVGDTITHTATVQGDGSFFTLWAVLNDPGTDPIPLASIPPPSAPIFECLSDNNTDFEDVSPLKRPINTASTPNMQCANPLDPSAIPIDNGTVTASVTGNSGDPDTNYEFFWSIGGSVITPEDFNQPSVTGLADGSYTVFAMHQMANCFTDTVTVVVDPGTLTVPSFPINLDAPNTNCTVANGQLSVNADPSLYDIVWFFGTDVVSGVPVANGQVASNLLGGETYTALIIDRNTGCFSASSLEVPEMAVRPTVTTTSTQPNCTNPSSGSLSALANGTTTGYTFNWYDGTSVLPPGNEDHVGAVYNNLTAGSYTVVAVDDATACTSNPITRTLASMAGPVVTATPTASQTSCIPGSPTGSASANVSTQIVGYTFDWYIGQNTSNVLQLNTPTVSNLAAGIYTVIATDNSNGCKDTTEVTVLNMITIPTVAVAGVNPMTTCTDPDGEVMVNANPLPNGDYDFIWYDGTLEKATSDYPGNTDNVLENLPVGDYTVKAVHKINGCESDPVTASVLDMTPSINIVVNDAQVVLPSDCNSDNGVLAVDVNEPGYFGDFHIEWFSGFPPLVSSFQEDVGSSSIASNLTSGVYSVRATNLNNGCSSIDTINLPFAESQILIELDKTDITTCDPPSFGQIIVKLTPGTANLGLTQFPQSDYVIQVYSGTVDFGLSHNAVPADHPNLIEVIQGDNAVLDSIYQTQPNLDPGPYLLVAVSRNSLTLDCRSVPVVETILDLTKNPIIRAQTITPNSTCDPITGSGEIILNIDGGNGANAADYSYEWFEGDDESQPITLGTIDASGNAHDLPPGNYTVKVTNITTSSTGCYSLATFTIMDTPPIIAAILSTEPDDNCSAPDGMATVTSILENGTPAALGNYSFEWMDESKNPLVPDPGPGNIANNLTAGTYFVRGTNTVTAVGCVTSDIQFIIEDHKMNTVFVALDTFAIPTACKKPMDDTGLLRIAPSGTSGSGYTIEWFSGPDDTGLSVDGPTAGVTGLHSFLPGTNGTFTVRVTNDDNSCDTTKTYTLPITTVPVTINASALPVTYCEMENGKLIAKVVHTISTIDNEYDFFWSAGAVPLLPTLYSTRTVNDVPTGMYNVYAVDQSDPSCVSNIVAANVANMIVPVSVDAILESPVQNCDPSIANGAASANVSGDLINFSYSWYEGTDTTGVTPFLTESPIALQLSSMWYTVLATQKTTGCADTANIFIPYMPIDIPDAEIVKLNDQTSCKDPNGKLAASVGGITVGYDFYWAQGFTVDPLSPEHTGIIWSGLDDDTYTVIAKQRSTGCLTNPDSEEIGEKLSYPTFEINTIKSMCDEDADGVSGPDDMPNGSATIRLTNNVVMDTIYWENLETGEFMGGPRIANIGPGLYHVTVLSDQGCEADTTFLIEAEIRPYNGISRNSTPGMNDYFHINCITDFPNNQVYLYNRAGTLVAKYDGYNNLDISFDGEANRGISPIGTNLPDGTYFYIIDKGNGDKPLSGIVEILK